MVEVPLFMDEVTRRVALEMGIDPGATGDPQGSPSARLDTGGTSPQRLVKNGAKSRGRGANSKRSAEEARRRREAARREKRAYHAELVRVLEFMESGQVGVIGEQLAKKHLANVRKCPGVTRRHWECGQLSFLPYSCDMPLCPWCQHRRSEAWAEGLEDVIESGLLEAPMFLTLSPPNVESLTPSVVSALGRAFTQLMRRQSMEQVKGGLRAIEVTYSQRHKWNLHVHALIDSAWMAHYPQTDIAPGGRWVVQAKGAKRTDAWRVKYSPWKVVKEWPGLAREFTAVCQNFPELANLSRQRDFDLDNPDHWYFVDIRRANRDVAQEIAKYVGKGSQLVEAGASVVIDYLLAIRGKRMLQTFGSLYDVGVKVDAKLGVVGELEPTAERPDRGNCPWPSCPYPEHPDYEFVSFGLVESSLGVDMEFSEATGQYRVIVGTDLGREVSRPKPRPKRKRILVAAGSDLSGSPPERLEYVPKPGGGFKMVYTQEWLAWVKQQRESFASEGK